MKEPSREPQSSERAHKKLRRAPKTIPRELKRPTWLPRSPQKTPKSSPESRRRHPRGPQEHPRGTQDGSLAPEKPPRHPQEHPKRAQEPPRRPPRAPKRGPREPQNALKTTFGSKTSIFQKSSCRRGGSSIFEGRRVILGAQNRHTDAPRREKTVLKQTRTREAAKKAPRRSPKALKSRSIGPADRLGAPKKL